MGTQHLLPAISVAALVALFGARASAQTAAVSLAWKAPSECPAEGTVRARVERMIGSPVRAKEALRANGSVSKDVNGFFHGEVELFVGRAIEQAKRRR